MLVGVTHINFEVSADTDHEVGDRETIVPQFHHLTAGAGDRRVDEGERFSNVEKDQAAADADLGGGYPAAEAVLFTETVERRGEIADQFAGFARMNINHRSRWAPKFRIPQKQYFAYGHNLCYLSRGKTWRVPASQSATYVDARDAISLPLFNAVAANSTGVSPM